MLLVFQTTSTAIDEGALDVVTLVLLVGFVISMVALSVLLTRREQDTSEESIPMQDAEKVPDIRRSSLSHPPAATQLRTIPTQATPAWLSGVIFPRAAQELSDATRVVERLLETRQSGEPGRGIALYSPSYRARLATTLAIPENELEHALETARIEGDGPALRSVELVSSSSEALAVRVGYEDRSFEIYRFVRVDGNLSIDSIEWA